MARPQHAKQEKELQSNLRGPELLDSPTLNKGTAFTQEERREYGLEGLLPHAVETIDRQLERVMEHLDAKPTELERYIYLNLPGDRTRDLRGATPEDYRRMLHRRGRGERRPGRADPAREGHAVPEPGQHSGNGSHDGDPRR